MMCYYLNVQFQGQKVKIAWIVPDPQSSAQLLRTVTYVSLMSLNIAETYSPQQEVLTDIICRDVRETE